MINQATPRLGRQSITSRVCSAKLDTPICLDECIHTLEHARAAIQLGACRIINIKLGRVGGYTPARQIHNLCQAKQIPVWCGGIVESGIGHAWQHINTREFLPTWQHNRKPPAIGSKT